jgi:hypothetical protein
MDPLPSPRNQLRYKVLLATVSFVLSSALAVLVFNSVVSRDVYYPEPDEVDVEWLEEGARFGPILKSTRKDQNKLHRKTGDSVLYGMNPKHPQVNSHGHRDSEIALAKAEGIKRIMVLGDSIAFGRTVARSDTFPNLLEARLNEEGPVYQVINTAVQGYTTYNEVQHYLQKGRQMQPDIVLLAFCMNDIANPRLHWGYTRERLSNIPDDAIPNLKYDREHAIPILARKKPMTLPDRHKAIPTYLSKEDDLSIELLLDRRTPEWQWLARQLLQLKAAVEAEGASFVLAIFPLAYQLEVGYPHFPQRQFAAFCAEHGIACVDLLPEFKQHPVQELYILDHGRKKTDVWHLMDYGHRVTADFLLEKLRAMNLVH